MACVSRLLLAFFCGMGLTASRPAAAQRYKVTDLGAFGPLHLSNSGQVIGYRGIIINILIEDVDGHIIRWDSGTPTDLGALGALPGRRHSRPSSANDSGQVVGYSFNFLGEVIPGAPYYFWFIPIDSRAFLWQNGRMTDLKNFDAKGTFPPGYDVEGAVNHLFSKAHAINNAGQVVGRAEGIVGETDVVRDFTNAFRTAPGSPINPDADRLQPLYDAYAINNLGHVVGLEVVPDVKHLLWRSNGDVTDLGKVNPTDLNDKDEVVGWVYGDQVTSWDQAVLWQDGVLTALTMHHGNSYARKINNKGQVIGDGAPGPYYGPFIWDKDHGMRALESLIRPHPGILWAAIDINESGQILGVMSGSVLLTPAPLEIVEPSQAIYYLDQDNYTKASIPLKARLIPPDPNPSLTVEWTIKVHTAVGTYKRDFEVTPKPSSAVDEEVNLDLKSPNGVYVGGDLTITASCMTSDGTRLEDTITIKVRGLPSGKDGTNGPYIPYAGINGINNAFEQNAVINAAVSGTNAKGKTVTGNDFAKAVAWHESGYKQFGSNGLPFFGHNERDGTDDIGLMQLNSKGLLRNDAKAIELYGWNWQKNVEKGLSHLGWCYRQAITWRDANKKSLKKPMTADQVWDDALCRYNRGPDTPLYRIESGKLKDNDAAGRTYVKKVRRVLNKDPWPWL